MFHKIIRQGSLLNPFIQALPFAILVIFFLPDIFNKYKAEILLSNSSPNKFIQKYIDINGDSRNEKVVLHNGSEFSLSVAQLSIYSYSNIPQFEIILDHDWIGVRNLFNADLNKNGIDEIFVFTQQRDTIYLNQFEYQNNDSIKSRKVKVAIVENLNQNFNLSINHIGNSDMNGDGIDEFIFVVMTGLNKKNRGVYAWDLKNNFIKRSPEFGISIIPSQFYMCNIDEDEALEILMSTQSNILFGSQLEADVNIPYPDTTSYVLVLDHDLTYLFNPIPIQCNYTYTVPLATTKGIKIAALVGVEQYGEITQQINLYNLDGSLFKSKNLTYHSAECVDWIFTRNDEIDDHFLVLHTQGLIECYNSELELIAVWEFEPLEGYPVKPIDINNDGSNEFIFKKTSNSIYTNHFIITQNDLSYPVEVSFDGMLNGASLSYKDKANDKGVLLLQLSNQDTYLFRYFENAYYKFEYIIWLLIYAILIVFIALVQWAQRIKTKNKINKEKDLAKFQLMAIKNQIDPHFTLNTLNAISSLYGKGDSNEAYKYMTKLSRLMLLVLNESDQISSTLKAEVDMIKNYIELQLIRFKDCFKYIINWDEERLGEREVPRMLVHTFTENAIKHGLRPLKEGGLLSISIREKNKHLYIVIEDNGIGRKAAALDKSLSSGKGVGISNSICQLYHQIRNVKVTYQVTDLFKIDEITNKEIPAGTRVTITVHPKLFKI